MLYSEDQKRKIKYLLFRMSELKGGNTLSPHFSDGYPFHTFIDRFGNYLLKEPQLKEDYVYNFLEENPNIKEKVDLIELAWQYYLVYGTPNGDLFKHNTLFSSIKMQKGLTLIHCTMNYQKIIETGVIYPSGGCLGASIYCVPLRYDGRIHNLTKFILEYELPGFIQNNPRLTTEVKTLAIHIESENFIHSNEESNGIDYLLMGNLQKNIYDKFKESLNIDKSIFTNLEKDVIKQIKSAQKFLNLCTLYKLDEVSDGLFIDSFEKAIISLPFLGYLYFEVLVEYISLFQNDEYSLELKEQGELNNFNYKKMVFDLSPNLFQSFRLIDFRPNIQDIISYLKRKSKNNEIFTHFLEDQFVDFFKWRFANYVRYKLMNSNILDDQFEAETLKETNSSLFGHLIHREIRMNKKLNEYSKFYDEERANIIWGVWNKDDIVFPYNSITPKGEVGINPGYENLDYKVYDAKIDQMSGYVHLKKELNIKLGFKLIESNIAIMRSLYKVRNS